MVSLGFVAPDKPIPSPDMSFVRMFNDNSVGWQQRGQYAIWTGASAGETKYRLLERMGNRVARIEHEDGSVVFHKVAAGTAFTVENFTGFWLTFDSDAMWLDTPGPSGRFAVLAVGGAAGKPGHAVLDWTCPHCGTAINPRSLDIGPLGFSSFLRKASALAAEFNLDSQLRTCSHCNTVHPPLMTTLKLNETQLPEGARS
jgi:hypothetical protein